MPVAMRPPMARSWPAGLDESAARDIVRPAPLRPPMRDRISQNTRRAENAAKISAKAVKDAEAALATSARVALWRRACFVCGAPAMCGHREPELIECWRIL